MLTQLRLTIQINNFINTNSFFNLLIMTKKDRLSFRLYAFLIYTLKSLRNSCIANMTYNLFFNFLV